MTDHYPAILHLPCLRCGLHRFIMEDHGHRAKEVTTEELRAVLAMPPEDDES